MLPTAKHGILPSSGRMHKTRGFPGNEESGPARTDASQCMCPVLTAWTVPSGVVVKGERAGERAHRATA